MKLAEASRPAMNGEPSVRERADLLARRLEGTQAELRVRDEEKARLDTELGTVRTTLAAKDEQMRKALHDLEASLKEEIAKGTSSVRGDAHSVNVVLAERILYDSGSAEIKPGGLKVLRRIADALRVSPNTYARVEGHTDDVPIRSGPPPRLLSNFDLSLARTLALV